MLSKKTGLWIRPCHLCIEYYSYSPFKFVYSRLISGWVSRMWTEMGFSATLSLRWALQETFSLIFKPDSSRLYSSVDIRNKFVPYPVSSSVHALLVSLSMFVKGTSNLEKKILETYRRKEKSTKIWKFIKNGRLSEQELKPKLFTGKKARCALITSLYFS